MTVAALVGMETQSSTVVAPLVRSRAPARGSRLFRAGVCAAGLLLSGAPALAAAPASADAIARTHSAQLDPSASPGTTRSDPSLPREPNPTGITVPDDASSEEIDRGEYGVGLGLLILGGVVLTALVVGLFMVLMRRTWGEHHEAGAPSRP
ncbi:MAG TPA: hypothetical protein VFS67_28315 [Polyangiaceae bacterium]|nr:hypothetical protein [Polyangiaceae bacterium]